MSYSPEPDSHIRHKIKVVSDLSNYATKKELEHATGKLSDVVDNEVVKNTKFNQLKTKVNNLEKKIPGKTTLIHINQCNTDKQNVEKKYGDVDKKIPDTSGFSDYNCFKYKK